jgi:hypothetical protein
VCEARARMHRPVTKRRYVALEQISGIFHTYQISRREASLASAERTSLFG